MLHAQWPLPDCRVIVAWIGSCQVQAKEGSVPLRDVEDTVRERYGQERSQRRKCLDHEERTDPW